MMTKVAVMVVGTLLVVACGGSYAPSSPSELVANSSSTGDNAAETGRTSPAAPLALLGQRRVGFGFNGTVSGFPKGRVFLTGGGAFEQDSQFVAAGGGFTCIEAVLQGPLSQSINANHPGACLDGEGIRWDTAALLDRTTFKCTGAASEETAVTSDSTVVLQADFYRAGDGNDESFTARMIVSSGDISANFPGVNLWVQGVGCGVAQTANFNQ